MRHPVASTRWPDAFSSPSRSPWRSRPSRRPGSRRSRCARSRSEAPGRSARRIRRSRSSSWGSTGAARAVSSCGHVRPAAPGRRWQPVAEDEDGPDPGGAEQRAGNGWRVSAPVWVGTAVALEVRTFGRVTRARALTVRSPDLEGPLPGDGLCRDATRRRAIGMARGRGDREGEARLCGRAPHGARPPHRGNEHVHAAPGARRRSCDPALPRQGERLERHRLQRARRPLRHRLRGPCGRPRPERRRRARPRVQHGLVRNRRDGRLPDRRPACRRGRRARQDARVATRPRTRRPALDVQRRLLGQRAVQARHPRLPSRDLRAPRHRAHDMPGRKAVRASRRDRPPRRGARPAEALCANGRDRRVGRVPLPGAGLVGAAVERRGHGPGGPRARPRHGHRGDGRLDMAPARPRPRGNQMANGDSACDSRRGHDRHRGEPDDADDDPSAERRDRRAGDDHAERRRAGGHDDDCVHAHGRRERHRRGRRPRRCDGRRAREPSLAAGGSTIGDVRRRRLAGRHLPRPRHGPGDRRTRGGRRDPASGSAARSEP